jgi:hypothetical protein
MRSNNILHWGYGPLGRRERSELRAAKPLAQQRGQQFASRGRGNPPPPIRRWMPDARCVLTPKVPHAGGSPDSPKVPAPTPPCAVCVLRSPALFSARSRPRHTQRPDRVRSAVVLLAIGAFQRPSSQRLLHYWSPSSFHFPPCVGSCSGPII